MKEDGTCAVSAELHWGHGNLGSSCTGWGDGGVDVFDEHIRADHGLLAVDQSNCKSAHQATTSLAHQLEDLQFLVQWTALLQHSIS